MPHSTADLLALRSAVLSDAERIIEPIRAAATSVDGSTWPAMQSGHDVFEAAELAAAAARSLRGPRPSGVAVLPNADRARAGASIRAKHDARMLQSIGLRVLAIDHELLRRRLGARRPDAAPDGPHPLDLLEAITAPEGTC